METLTVPAIRVMQMSNKLYSFAVDGKALHRFAGVSGSRRDGAELRGYQRPEVRAHIELIRRYIESDSPMIPTAVVVAFDDRVIFEPEDGADLDAISCAGTLMIPLDADDLPGWLVDGQQRAAAVRAADVASFPLCVTAFVGGESRQREQFILVNSTKPLPKGVIELILSGDAGMPGVSQRKLWQGQ